MEYPKYMYRRGHQGIEAVLFTSREEESAAAGPLFDNPAKIPAEVKSPLFAKTVEELKAMLVEKGWAKKDLRGVKEADLIKMLEALA